MLTGAEKWAHILERYLIINVGNKNVVFVLVTGKFFSSFLHNGGSAAENSTVVILA